MFRRDTNLSPAQRANKAILNIIARLGGCGFLIYFVYKILTIPPEESPGKTAATIIAIAFLLISAVIIFITIKDLVIGFRTGRFKASTYEELDLAEYLAKRGAESSECGCDGEQQGLDANDDGEADQEADEESED